MTLHGTLKDLAEHLVQRIEANNAQVPDFDYFAETFSKNIGDVYDLIVCAHNLERKVIRALVAHVGRWCEREDGLHLFYDAHQLYVLLAALANKGGQAEQVYDVIARKVGFI